MIAYNYLTISDKSIIQERNYEEENNKLKKMIDVSIVAKNEYRDIVHIVDSLAVRPKNMKFTQLNVNTKEFTIEAFSIDSNNFTIYVEDFNRNEIFKNIQIEKITSTDPPYKVATIKGVLKEAQK